MKLDLGPVQESKTLPCGCVAITRTNGYDTIEPCMGHALRDSGQAMASAIARVEHAIRGQTEALRDLRPAQRMPRRAGVIRRAWLWLFGTGY